MHRYDTSRLIPEPFETYKSGYGKYLSSHQLQDFMKSPLLYHHRRVGLSATQDTSAYATGRATHTRILEDRDTYEQRYAIGGPINPATNRPYGTATKKYAEWVAIQQRPVISHEKAELIECLNCGVRQNPIASAMLSDGIAEGVLRAEYCELPCQIRIDWYSPEFGLVDLKTCKDLDWFEHDARKYGYIHQLAFYQNVTERATGEFPPVFFIAMEKREPYRCGVWEITSERLHQASEEIQTAIRRLHQATAEDLWVTGYEELRYIV